jgi:PKD repeat protein
LLSNATGTANLADVGLNTISGTVTQQRFLDLSLDGWYELASPCVGSTLANWNDDGLTTSGFPNSDFPNFSFINVYTYEENNANGIKSDGWAAATDISNTSGPDHGHRYYIGAGGYTMSVTGTVNSGAYVFPLDYEDDAGNGEEEGWNLIGNPFPSTVDWDAVAGSEMTALENSIWVFSAVNGNYGAYTQLTGGFGTNGVTRYIPSSQGFWVHARGAGPGLTFLESIKAPTQNPSFVKAGGNPYAQPMTLRLKVTGSQNAFQDESILVLDSASTATTYDMKDAQKFYAPSDYIDYVPSSAFVMNDTTDLSIMALDNASVFSVPVRVLGGSLVHGVHTLEWSGMDGFRPDACLSLEDLHTGITVDLRANPIYTYTSSDTTTMPRFVLHVNGSIEGTIVDASCDIMTDGEITATVTSGSAFDLMWKNGNGDTLQITPSVTTMDVLSGLGAGAYFVTSSGGDCALGENEFIITSPEPVVADFSTSADTVYLSLGGTVDFTNISTGAIGYDWDFGDANSSAVMSPSHTYAAVGTYTITMTADNGSALCDAVAIGSVVVAASPVGIDETLANNGFLVLQNENGVALQFELNAVTNLQIDVVNLLGQTVIPTTQQQVKNQTIELSGMTILNPGVYFVVVSYDGKQLTEKVQWTK